MIMYKFCFKGENAKECGEFAKALSKCENAREIKTRYMPRIDLFEVEVEFKVVHAKWITHDYKKTNSRLDMEYPYECSNCNHRQGLLPFKYCPNCGAKMRKDNE